MVREPAWTAEIAGSTRKQARLTASEIEGSAFAGAEHA